MPALHDMACSSCGALHTNQPWNNEGKRCSACTSGRLEIVWSVSHHRDAAVHSKERTALLYSAKEGKWQYPATNSEAIPDRLRKRGYERVEMTSLRALEQHGKQTGALSERAYFDKGSGRGFDE